MNVFISKVNILVKGAAEIKYFFDIFQETLVINYNFCC